MSFTEYQNKTLKRLTKLDREMRAINKQEEELVKKLKRRFKEKQNQYHKVLAELHEKQRRYYGLR